MPHRQVLCFRKCGPWTVVGSEGSRGEKNKYIVKPQCNSWHSGQKTDGHDHSLPDTKCPQEPRMALSHWPPTSTFGKMKCNILLCLQTSSSDHSSASHLSRWPERGSGHSARRAFCPARGHFAQRARAPTNQKGATYAQTQRRHTQTRTYIQ